ncbi:CidA/LrgA family protein [Salinarimonas soli]|uniref:CidA/LrgA family protein n=1 Tax=Salinarimonas soli TaxID=1638099 RepID=A0A5B2VGU6_9HYPH|nr:CidA/LrgA family protein [Salinarimonas soli]KAA2237776.1 CidA/LrgA family protein [Salinarimonas soli]
MLRPLVLLILLQFIGEALARLGGIPIPGPVIGLALLALAAGMVPRLFSEVEATADTILRHLSLLFVPAGVGVLQHLGLIRREALPIVAVLLLSTLLTLLATALTFAWLARDEDAPRGSDEP